jgi:hypothetical protein
MPRHTTMHSLKSKLHPLFRDNGKLQPWFWLLCCSQSFEYGAHALPCSSLTRRFIGCQGKLHVQMAAYSEHNFHIFIAMHLPLQLKLYHKKMSTEAEEAVVMVAFAT